MTDVLFYQLAQQPLERVLPPILEKTLARGWRALVRCSSETVLESLDDRLWTYRKDAFLPHGRADRAEAARQPVCLSMTSDNTNAADVLILVDEARFAADMADRFARVCLVFDHHTPSALEKAREDWRQVRALGVPAEYWAQEAGGWVRKAVTKA